MVQINSAIFINGQNPSLGITVAFDVFELGSFGLQIVSGLILVKSVYNIREFYRSQGEEDALNT